MGTTDPLSKHLGEASQALRAMSQSTSDSSTPKAKESRTDATLRHSMIAKLFALFPQSGGDESIGMRMLAYHTELGDIHVAVLGPALRRLVRDAKRPQFLPTVAEIRRSAAMVLRAVRGGRSALAPPESEPATELNVERLIALGPKPGEPCPYPQLASPSGTPALRAGGA